MSLRIAAGLIKATRRMRKLARTSSAMNGVFRHTRPSVHVAPALERSLRALTDLFEAKKTPRRPSTPTKTPGGRFLTAHFANGAGTRAYKVYLPQGDPRPGLPLVVMLHGCKQAPDDFAAGTGMNALAEKYGFIVAYPTQARSANGSQCWNWFQTQDQARDQGEPSIIAGITREVIERYGIDPQRVYIAGLSAGGAMAAIMATTYPDLYTAVGIHSGLPYAAASDVTSAFAAMRGEGGLRASERSRDNAVLRTVPTIIFHGDADKTVHPDNAGQLLAQAAPPANTSSGAAGVVQRGDARGRTYTMTLYRDRAGKSLLEHWLVHGGGHAWFGGSKNGSYTDPVGPDASREMVRFFLQHA